jgi:ribonuclease Z
LINGPFDDPGLYVPLQFENRALLFDLGDLAGLATREILKISHVFVTHTHMDHFIGFDRLLRVLLGRAKTVCIFGPRGLFKNVEGKLAGYTWNLVGNYTESLELQVHEVGGRTVRSRRYSCRNRFRRQTDIAPHPFRGTIVEEAGFSVVADVLDHGVACLGFLLKEPFHVNIRKEALEELDLVPGPWLKRFKEALHAGNPPGTVIRAAATGPVRGKAFMLSELAERVALITPGQKLCYIADVAFTPANARKILALAKDCDHLYIESAFLQADASAAQRKAHLTARQAGWLAGTACASRMTPFHFSPRYAEDRGRLEAEALEAFRKAKAHVERVQTTSSPSIHP